jgi:hypothetical protein
MAILCCLHKHRKPLEIVLFQACRRLNGSNQLILAIVGFTVSTQSGGFKAFIELFEIGIDKLTLLFKQAVTLKVAFDQEGAEVFDFEYPHRLGVA